MIPTLMTEKVQQALEFATKAHEGQFRKNSKLPYITHPIAVREIAIGLFVSDGVKFLYSKADWLKEQIEIVSLLHDVLEDTEVTPCELGQEFGKDVLGAVIALTKSEGANYLDAVLDAKAHPIARIVKIADNIHNMSDLKEGTLKDKYRLSKYILEN